jgi:hypothetical protein
MLKAGLQVVVADPVGVTWGRCGSLRQAHPRGLRRGLGTGGGPKGGISVSDSIDSPPRVSRIPVEWSDPRIVMPHLVEQVTEWLTAWREIEQDLTVVQGALDSNGEVLDRAHILAMVTSIHARTLELGHQVGQRATSYSLIAQDLRRG